MIILVYVFLGFFDAFLWIIDEKHKKLEKMFLLFILYKMMDKFNASLVLEKGEKVFDEYERLWYWMERKELVGIFGDNEKQKQMIKTIEDFILGKFDEYKEKELLTALVLCTNHKIWYWYNKSTKWSEKLARMYDKMWRKIHGKMSKKLKGDELSWYYRAVD